MKPYNRKLPLLSIHIPKCGGTSLTRVLEQWFGNRLCFHYADERTGTAPKKMRTKTLFQTPKNICIHGHFNAKRGFGVTDYYPEVTQAITFLRDPLEVQQSVFFYNHKLKAEGKLFRDGKPMDLPDDIDEYLETTQPYFKYFLPDGLSSNNIESYFSNYFIYVGIIEHFQASLNALSVKLRKPPVTVPIENTSERFTKPSDSSIMEFKKKCSFEYQFYSLALQNYL